MSLNPEWVPPIVQIIICCISLIGGLYTLRLQVQVNKIELDAFKYQINQRIKVIEHQQDRVYISIEKLNSRIDENFKALVEAVKSN